MKPIHIDEITEQERKSPKGVFNVFQKHISLALGGKQDIGTWGGGHPFDLARVRVPAGAKNWPVHRHTTQWELYYVLEGKGRYFDGNQWQEIGAGHAVLAPPEENHQIENTGTSDLIFLVVADMPQADIIMYPNTDRILIKPQRKLLKEIPPNYFEGHE